MKRWFVGIAVLLVLAGVAANMAFVRAAEETTDSARLAIVWSSGDAEVAHKVCFMYVHNAKMQKWFNEVHLVVWGPSQRLLAADKEIQAKVKAMQESGVVVEACIACAESYGLVDTLRGLGVSVKPMGQPLTSFLKDGYKVLTF